MTQRLIRDSVLEVRVLLEARVLEGVRAPVGLQTGAVAAAVRVQADPLTGEVAAAADTVEETPVGEVVRAIPEVEVLEETRVTRRRILLEEGIFVPRVHNACVGPFVCGKGLNLLSF
jgi:hypothetical protein